jgi:hypothetical protein
MTAFSGLNATIAALAFAAIVFLLRSPLTEADLGANERREREEALAALVVCVLAHLITAALAQTVIGSPSPTAQWITSTAILPTFVFGATNLFMCIYLLVRGSAAILPTRLAGRVYDLVLLLLIIYTFAFALASTAVLSYENKRPIDLSIGLILLFGIAAAAPAAIGSLLAGKDEALEFVSRTPQFEALLTAEVIVIMALATAGLAMQIIQPISINSRLWTLIAIAIVAITSLLLSGSRLWLHAVTRLSPVTGNLNASSSNS